MSEVYDQAHVRISQIIGRRYNNPLGEAPFELLRRLLKDRPEPRVLDLGCGRGATSLWWARNANARVVALDPSPEMLEEARRLLSAEGLESRVELRQSGIESLSDDGTYDLVLAHDVLCYLEDKPPALCRIARQLAPEGIASITDYHANPGATGTAAVVSRWAIAAPPPFDAWLKLVERSGLSPLLFCDTTRQYREHWSSIRTRLDEHCEELIAAVGAESLRAFAGRASSILEAVSAAGGIGHLWAVLERGHRGQR
jgi:SAM-dependent methyltransferase